MEQTTWVSSTGVKNLIGDLQVMHIFKNNIMLPPTKNPSTGSWTTFNMPSLTFLLQNSKKIYISLNLTTYLIKADLP